MSGHGTSPEFEKKLQDLGARNAYMIQPRRTGPGTFAEFAPAPPLSVFAAVNPVYNAYCADCNEGDGPHDDEDDAQAWADQHNTDHHEWAEA